MAVPGAYANTIKTNSLLRLRWARLEGGLNRGFYCTEEAEQSKLQAAI